MKIFEVKSLALPEVKVIRFARFTDKRGYFTEIYKKSDFKNHPHIKFMKGVDFNQVNESYSKKGVIRGLHFQWNPYMAKLIRTIHGHMIDMVLDIRLDSPNFGKIIGYEMPSDKNNDYQEWIWVPVGFAHGNFFLKETIIEYFCTGEYSANYEAGISPLTGDIDWSLCDPKIKKLFDKLTKKNPLISEKDKSGLSVAQWKKDKRSKNFIFSSNNPSL